VLDDGIDCDRKARSHGDHFVAGLEPLLSEQRTGQRRKRHKVGR